MVEVDLTSEEEEEDQEETDEVQIVGEKPPGNQGPVSLKNGLKRLLLRQLSNEDDGGLLRGLANFFSRHQLKTMQEIQEENQGLYTCSKYIRAYKCYYDTVRTV